MVGRNHKGTNYLKGSDFEKQEDSRQHLNLKVEGSKGVLHIPTDCVSKFMRWISEILHYVAPCL